MGKEIFIPEIAKREENFFDGKFADFADLEVLYFFSELQGLTESIEADIQKLRGMPKEQKLEMIFSRVYHFVISFNGKPISSSYWDYTLFDRDMVIYYDVFKACFFLSLCMFLYDTNRVKGMSLREFIYKHAPQKYNVKESPNYFDYNNRPREFRESNSDKPESSSDLIRGDEDRLRQYRYRHLNKRPVYHPSTEWSAIRKVSEHEWELYFVLDGSDHEISDTFKRIRVLYSDLKKSLNSSMDDDYIGRLEGAFNKYLSKLKKIQYGRFLNLGKFCLDHICRDKTCYGINLYRFEKELSLYAVTGEVKHLLECRTEDEEKELLAKSVILKNIPFPKLYEYFGHFEDIRQVQIYTHTFLKFMDEVVQSSRLVIDKFVEEGLFGEDWMNAFLVATNELAESVLYDPTEIDYSVESRSQEMFIKDISAPVEAQISDMIELSRYRLDPSDSEDDII